MEQANMDRQENRYLSSCISATVESDQSASSNMEARTMNGQILSRNELKTLFYTGRKLTLIGCYVPMSAPQSRTVKAQRSYGYDMLKDDGKVSSLRFESGQTIEGFSDGNGFVEVVIWDADKKTVAAHYQLL